MEERVLFKFLESPEIYDIEPVEPDIVEKAKKKKTIADLVPRIRIPPANLKETPPEKILTPNVKIRLLIDVGMMESGKTTLAFTLSGYLGRYYEKKHGFRFYTIHAEDLVTAVKLIPEDAEIVYVIVDDAPVKHFAAQRLREDVYVVGAFFRIRHLALKKARKIKYVLLKFNTQRFKSLDVVFRSYSIITIYKTVLGDKWEQKELKEWLGSIIYSFLLGITEAIYSYHLEEFKRFYVFRTFGGFRGLGEIDAIYEPYNLIRSPTMDTLDQMFLLDDLSSLAEPLIRAAGLMGLPWIWVRDNLLPTLRELRVKIDQNKAHKIYKQAKERAQKMESSELLDELDRSKNVFYNGEVE